MKKSELKNKESLGRSMVEMLSEQKCPVDTFGAKARACPFLNAGVRLNKNGNKPSVRSVVGEGKTRALRSKLFVFETGRSMVEMLGVLAVIGVLSLGGILGYMYAMNYYQANSIANEVNLMRTDAKVKIGQGAERLALGAPYESNTSNSLSGGKGVINFNGYPVEYDCLEGDSLLDDCREADGYHITLSNIPQGVCKTLATLLNGMDERRVVEVNDAEFTGASLCDEEYNKVAVFFNAEANLSGFGDDNGDDDFGCETDDDCPHYCVAGVCVECKNNGDCGNKICDQSQGVCVNCSSDTDCGSGYCLDNTVCVECTQNNQCESGVCTDSHTCGSCTDDSDCDSPLHCDNGACVHCRSAVDCGAGQACVNGECSDSCTDDSECRTDEHCEDGKCVKNCTTSDDCEGFGCNTKNGRCEPCTNTDSLCNGTNKVCNEENGQCVACKTSADCKTPAAPVCDESTHTCAKCTTDPQCGDSVYDHCITASGSTQGQCKKCTSSSPYFNGTTCTSCPTATPQWNEKSGVCEACSGGRTWNSSKKICECSGYSVWDETKQICTYECRSNDDCKGKGYAKPYCYMRIGDSCSDNGEFVNDSTSRYFSGTCADAAKEIKTSGTVNGRTMYVSSKEMTYWSAERFCDALGKKRVSRTSLGCSGWTSNYYCMSNSSYAGGSSSSTIAKELYELYKNVNYNNAWLDDDYGNSCYAYYVTLDYGRVDYHNRSTNNQALCE